MENTMKTQLKINGLKIGINILIASTILTTGCAANMAANGQNGPDLNIVQQEKSRRDIERHLGAPESVLILENGHQVATYNVEARTKPNLLRAAGHGTMDLFTLGLWEVVGGPTEMYIGRRVSVAVEYDRNGQFMALKEV